MGRSLVVFFLSLLLCSALSKPQQRQREIAEIEGVDVARSLPVAAPSGGERKLDEHGRLELSKRSLEGARSTLNSTSKVERSEEARSPGQGASTDSPDVASHLQKRYVPKNGGRKKKGMRKKMRARKKMPRPSSRRSKEHAKRQAEQKEPAIAPLSGSFKDLSALARDSDHQKPAGLLAAEGRPRLAKRDLTESKRSGNSTSSKSSEGGQRARKKKKPSGSLELARLGDRYKGRLLNKIVIKANGKSPAKGEPSKEDPSKRDTRHVSYASGQPAKKDHLPSTVAKDEKSPSKDKTREKRWRHRKGRKGRGRQRRRRRRRRRRPRKRGRCRRGMCRRRVRRRRRPRNDSSASNSTLPTVAKTPKPASPVKAAPSAQRLKRSLGNPLTERSQTPAARQSSYNPFERLASDLLFNIWN